MFPYKCNNGRMLHTHFNLLLQVAYSFCLLVVIFLQTDHLVIAFIKPGVQQLNLPLSFGNSLVALVELDQQVPFVLFQTTHLATQLLVGSHTWRVGESNAAEITTSEVKLLGTHYAEVIRGTQNYTMVLRYRHNDMVL